MKTEHWNWLKKNDACEESIEWVEENSIDSLEEAWEVCERGDWLLWLASRLGVDKRKLTMCSALCAHTVVQYMDDTRSRNAVRIAFLWGRGKATDSQLEEAKKEAARAANADNAWYADAAWAAAAAAAAAWAATATADDAANAANAANAAWVAAYAKENQRKTSEIARKILTDDIMKKIKEMR